jgi:hypothetical protein
VWPNGTHGICGDPAGAPQNHVVGGSMYRGTVVGENRFIELGCARFITAELLKS